jgi:hypothetical protein
LLFALLFATMFSSMFDLISKVHNHQKRKVIQRPLTAGSSHLGVIELHISSKKDSSVISNALFNM